MNTRDPNGSIQHCQPSGDGFFAGLVEVIFNVVFELLAELLTGLFH